eukprot:TRINITY_DN2561_c0_g2_i1.p1 TRINITY_DN2561_c0_g2~~TRINITY_DN2561_c0_g2_i1.p1  ORF type:complete len:355 (-),score=128.26 TRINITY_DN2561_c0_g2_i1:78-1094(-)
MTHVLELAGVNLDKKDGPFRKSDPYLNFRRLDDNSPIHSTEYVKQNLNPEWKKLDFNQKRFGDEHDPTVLVECWDWDSVGSHDLIGTFRAKCSELTHTGSEFQLVSKKGKNSGKIIVKSATKNVVAEKKEEPVKKEEPAEKEAVKKDNNLPDNAAALKFLADEVVLEMEKAKVTPKELTKEEREVYDENYLAELFADFQAGKGSKSDWNYALILAIERGKPEIVKALIESGRVDPSFNFNEPIRLSSFAKNGVETMRVLLTHPRVDPTANDIPLSNPCFDGNEEMVKLLLADPRINPSSADNRALRNAIKGNHQNIVKILLAHPKISLTSANRKEFGL